MRLELSVIQHLRCFLGRAALLAALGCGLCIPSQAQTQKPNLPNPVKFIHKLDIVANAVREVLNNMGFKIEVEDRKGGRIATRPYEFITGSLTASEVEKVAVKTETVNSSLTKAQYSVEAILEIVSPTETMVTVHTKMEALSRDSDGTEKWIPLESLGTYERRILGRISAILMSDDQSEEKKKGFWGKSPQPVDPRQPRLPTVPSR